MPRHIPRSMGPPVTTSAGMSADAAPIIMAGVVLSQPERRTTPSRGLARMHSSTSMDIKLRNIMAVGFMSASPSEITGNSKGIPPAMSTPRLTASATWRRWLLQLFNSLQLLAMPMTGRFSNTASEKPSAFSQARCTKLSRPVRANHVWLRSFPFFMSFLPVPRDNTRPFALFASSRSVLSSPRRR